MINEKLINCQDIHRTLFRTTIVFLTVLLGSSSALLGQTTQSTKNTADQTLRSTGRVNPSTLGMEMDIPLGSYPARGINLPLGMSYSSKVWRFEEFASILQQHGATHVYVSPKYAEDSASGWSSSLEQAYIEYTGERNLFDGSGRPLVELYAGGQSPEGKLYVKRITVILPGGSSHVLIADHAAFSLQPEETVPSSAWETTFYATDGSGLKYVQDSGNGIFKLYMPDGSFYDFSSTRENKAPLDSTKIRRATRLTDTHGNYVQFNNPTTAYPNGYWSDQLGRAFPIMIPRQAPALGSGQSVLEQEFTFPGMSGPYTVRWKRLKGDSAAESAFTDFNTQVLKYDGHINYQTSPTTYSPALFYDFSNMGPCSTNKLFVLVTGTEKFNPVLLTEIVLPNGASYRFSYNEYGELERVNYPTGGREEIDYEPVASLAELGKPYQMSNRGVVNRKIFESDSDPTADTWTFSAGSSKNNFRTSVVAPDGTQTDRFMHRGVPEPSCGSQNSPAAAQNGYGTRWGYDNVLSGMPYEERSFSSDGNIVKRTLTRWDVSTSSTVLTVTPQRFVAYNARVLSNESIVFDGDAGLSSAATLEYDSDKDDLGSPLNVTKQTEYAHKIASGGSSFSPATSTQAPADDAPVIPDPTSGATAVRITETTYKNDTSYRNRNLLKLPIQVIIKDPSTLGVKSKGEIVYDESTYLVSDSVTGTVPGWADPGSSVRGLPTTTRAWYDIAGNQYVQSRVQYNQFGSPRKSWDGNGNMSEMRYDDNFADAIDRHTYAFPTKTLSPIASDGTYGINDELETATTYNYTTGLPASATDANDQTTQVSYNDPVTNIPDPLLRVRKVTAPNGHQTITEYGAGTSASTRFVKTRSQIDDSNWKEGYSWYDGLGRTIKSQSIDSNGDVFAETEYDNMSRAIRATNPYRANETIYWTENIFDTAGRPWKTTTPDGAYVETTYSVATTGGNIGSAVTVKDQAGKLRRSITNALGQLTRVDEPNAAGQLGAIDAPNQPTIYTYDLVSNLIQVQQTGDNNEECGTSTTTCSQTRSFQYDNLSRLKQATNPESGTIQYAYDSNGNLTTKTDARGIVTTYAYDALNRVMTRQYTNEPSGSETPDVSYYYDLLTNAKGKLIKVTNGTGSDRSTTEYVSFDILGRVTASKQTTDGVTYGNGSTDSPMTYSYNLSGALIEQQYPSGRKVQNTLDSNGDLEMVRSRKNANSGYWAYANNFSYNAAGAMTSMQLGNGRWESATFNSRLQPTQIALGVTPGATNLLDLDYTYGTTANNGNLLTQTITVASVGQTNGFTAVQTFNYDSLNRLKDATEDITPTGGSTTQSWKQVFSFDRYGNRNFVTGTGQTTTLGSCATAVCNPTISPNDNKLTSTGYTFDAAGNTTADAESRSFVYDAENKQVSVSDTNGTVGEYFYDGDGKRVKKYVPSTGETTIFLYDAGGKLIAEYSTIVASTNDAKVAYLTNDHLGSPRINTDANGAVTARHDYHPFGEEISTSQRTTGIGYADDTVRKQFTGYERDTETDLDFAQARYFNKNLGRFNSVDPIMMEKRRLADPQAINLYAYTRNNPLKYVDPDGEKYKGTDDKEVIIKRAKVDGKKIWVIKSDNASADLKKLVGLVNNSGSRTANNMFSKLNKHDTMVNIVIDSTSSRTQDEINSGSTTIGLHQPHDKNGPLTFNDATDKFDGKADAALGDRGTYREATITLFEKKMEELGYSGDRLDAKLAGVFGHETRHDLDPIQVRAGLTGTGSDAIWHPEKNGNPKKESPDYFEGKIIKQIERRKGIKVD